MLIHLLLPTKVTVVPLQELPSNSPKELVLNFNSSTELNTATFRGGRRWKCLIVYHPDRKSVV